MQYDLIDAGKYENRHKSNQREAYAWNHWQPIMNEKIGQYCKGKNVIDLGCGTGVMTSLISQHASSVIGVDNSPNMLSYMKAIRPSLKSILADASHIPVDSNSIDVIVAIGILDYTNRETTLLEINRLLKDEGVAIIHTFNKNSLFANISHAIDWFFGNNNLSHQDINFNDSIKLFKRYNLNLVESWADDGLIYVPDFIDKLCGKMIYQSVERSLSVFERNPFCATMLFVLRKENT